MISSPVFLQVVSALALSLALALVTMPLVMHFASRVGLVDHPSERKRHGNAIPVVGGLAVFVSVLLACILLSVGREAMLPLVIGAVLVIIGTFDDRFEAGARQRLLVHVVTALSMIYFGDVAIGNVGRLFGEQPLMLSGWASVVFTVMCTVGVINAINMIDGVDGLSGTITLMSLASLAGFALIDGHITAAVVMYAFIGALSGFLYYNARWFRKRAVVFLGDAGSTLLGFYLVWYFIDLTQGTSATLSPVAAGWVFGLPLADTVSVIVGRLRHGRSPFEAGRDHLHHQLLDAGFSVNRTVAIMACLHGISILLAIVISSYRVLEPLMFWVFVGIVIMHHFMTPRLLQRRQLVPGS